MTLKHLKGPLIKIFRTPTIYGFVMLSCKIIYKLQSKEGFRKGMQCS